MDTEPEPQPKQAPRSLIHELQGLDTAIYQAVAATPTPKLDAALHGLTSLADNSKLWFATAALLALVGGKKGRRAALNGVGSIGLASLVTNQGFKRAHRRPRPDWEIAEVPAFRRVPMPTSTSFPSGHSASAFAFAEGVAHTVPWLGIPLRMAATTVAYTRVHAGVHYPGDVVAGSLIGMASGQLAPRVMRPLNERIVPGG
jgi:undecaprenyl-diphosphatase